MPAASSPSALCIVSTGIVKAVWESPPQRVNNFGLEAPSHRYFYNNSSLCNFSINQSYVPCFPSDNVSRVVLLYHNTLKLPTILSNSAEMRLKPTGLRHTSLLVQV